jgi:hypothetical protein
MRKGLNEKRCKQACIGTHLEVAQWLETLRPEKYKILNYSVFDKGIKEIIYHIKYNYKVAYFVDK